MRLEAVALFPDGTQSRVALAWDHSVAVAHAGRDPDAVRAQVAAAVKPETSRTVSCTESHAAPCPSSSAIPRPYAIPAFYWINPDNITSNSRLSVVGEGTSGEVGVFMARDETGELFFTVASDHTDRELERLSVSKAKQICQKIIAPCFWRVADVRNHWDEIEISSSVPDGQGGYRIYQEGTLGDLLIPERLWELALQDLPTVGRNGDRIALFCGSVPLKGEIVSASEFRMTLADPLLGRSIHYGYSVQQLPDRS